MSLMLKKLHFFGKCLDVSSEKPKVSILCDIVYISLFV